MSELDFSQMKFDPTAVPDGMTMVEYYPYLQNYEEFSKASDRIMRFACFMADPSSPFATIMDVDLKLNNSLAKAGYDPQKESELWENIKSGFNKQCNNIIVRFLSIFSNARFTTLYVQKQHYYNQVAVLMLPVDVRDEDFLKKQDMKDKMLPRIEDLEKKISLNESNLFSDEFTKNAFDLDSSLKYQLLAEHYSETDEEAY